jgi:hypothetical protein
MNALAALRPSAFNYCPFTPNDGDKFSQAGVDRMKALALTVVAAGRAVQSRPRLVTPAPMDGLTATEEGFRRQIVEWVKAQCSAGLAELIDRDATLTNYTLVTGGFKAGLGATTLHPNQLGNTQVVANNWSPAVGAQF